MPADAELNSTMNAPIKKKKKEVSHQTRIRRDYVIKML